MAFKRICDDVKNMNMIELAHNHVFVKGGEAWYRDYDREISVRNLMREICCKYASPADADQLTDDELDEAMHDNLQFGTDEPEGVIALLYMTMWGMADVREWLKAREERNIPAAWDWDVLQAAISTYGETAQVDMAIEEMSELTKALLKHRRGRYSPETWDFGATLNNIYEEIADVIIMITQLILIYGGRSEIQRLIAEKTERLERRLKSATKETDTDDGTREEKA